MIIMKYITLIITFFLILLNVAIGQKIKVIPKNIPKVNVNQVKIKNHANSNSIFGNKKNHPKYEKKNDLEKSKAVEKKKTEVTKPNTAAKK